MQPKVGDIIAPSDESHERYRITIIHGYDDKGRLEVTSTELDGSDPQIHTVLGWSLKVKKKVLNLPQWF